MKSGTPPIAAAMFEKSRAFCPSSNLLKNALCVMSLVRGGPCRLPASAGLAYPIVRTAVLNQQVPILSAGPGRQGLHTHPPEFTSMKDHIIVCGLGRVGYRVAEVLWRLGEAVTVITEPTREEWVSTVRERGAEVLIGDARTEDRLLEAGILTARAIIATTSNDLVNTEIALDSKRLRPDLPIVVRIFDQALGEQLEEAFDLRRALGMSVLSAPSFAAAALGERVIASFRLGDELFVVGSLELDDPQKSEADGRTHAAQHRAAPILAEPGESEVLESQGRVVLAERGDWEKLSSSSHAPGAEHRRQEMKEALRHAFFPSHWFAFVRQVWGSAPIPLRVVFVTLNVILLLSVFVFRAGMGLSTVDAFYFLITTVTTTGYGDISPLKATDALKIYACLVMILGSALVATLYSIITDFVVTSRFMQLLGRQRVPQRGHFIVAGLGSVGFRVVEKFRLAGAQVVGIDRNGQGHLAEAIRVHSPVIVGDARMKETLAKAGIAGARAVVAVTDDDAANISVALQARRLNPRARTVVRLFDGDFAKKVQSALDIDVAMGAFTIGAPTFAAAALYPNVLTAFILESRLIVVLHRDAGSEWHGLSPSRIFHDEGVRPLMIKGAAQKRYSPCNDESVLHRDDKVIAILSRQLSA